MIASFVMDLLLEDVNRVLKYFYRVFPAFCFGDSLFQIAIESASSGGTFDYYEEADGDTDYFQREVAGANIGYLYSFGFVFLAITLLIEYVKSSVSLTEYFSFCKPIPRNEQQKPDIDEDVKKEADRVLSSDNISNLDIEHQTQTDVLKMMNLRKVYFNGKVAVQDVSLGIPEGECFGYLGVNGAGKTTTLKCLTGDVFPTGGKAFINGHNVVSEQWKVRQDIGYCSQFSSILGLLTVKEHLRLFCRIKMISDVELAITSLMSLLSLTSFQNTLSKNLSGGNKRKLSVAIAMIGAPKVMLLDEPSTGMDVASRRFMWDVILNMVSGKYTGEKTSVVLTTHSMEECEALCSRLGIMVDGRIRCIGSSQHLKSRFGKGYTVEIKLEKVSKEEIATALTSLQVGSDRLVLYHDVKPMLDTLKEPEILKRFLDNPCNVSTALTSSLYGAGVTVNVFLDWVLLQKQVIELESFLGEKFTGVELVESQDYRVTYRLAKTDEIKLSQIFDAIESNKDDLHISQYAVSQTTLEQIFNSFAATQSGL